MNLIQILADIICNTLLDPEVLDNARTRAGAFTRNCKKLPYWTLMKLLMKNIKSKAWADLLYTIFVFDRGYASETLITNDVSLDQSMFQMCCFLRWPVEED